MGNGLIVLALCYAAAGFLLFVAVIDAYRAMNKRLGAGRCVIYAGLASVWPAWILLVILDAFVTVIDRANNVRR